MNVEGRMFDARDLPSNVICHSDQIIDFVLVYFWHSRRPIHVASSSFVAPSSTYPTGIYFLYI